jgi:hypothetical protein
MMTATTALKLPLLLGALLAAGVTAPARAQSDWASQGPLNNAFVFNLGGFLFTTDTRASLNGTTSNDEDVDFDRTFGKPGDATRIRADALWRITPAHHLRLMYFDNTTDRTRAIDRTIHWGDHTFQTGAVVDSQIKFKMMEAAYEWAFLKEPTYEVAASFGVHVMDISLRLAGTATITDANGNTSVAQFSSKSGSVTAPLPVVGIRAGWAVAPQWYLEAQGQIFKAEVNGVDGRVNDLRASATWMFNPNFGLGLGYNRFRTTVVVDKDSFNGRMRVGYSGAQVFLTGTF